MVNEQNISRNLINFLSGSGRRFIAMLEAYLDESGTHAGAEMLCVAGYIGDRGQWYKFEREWNKQLIDSGISCFHAKESESNILKAPLASLIEKNKLHGFIVSVRPEIYKNHAGAHFKSSLGNAYSACAFGCAMEMCKYAKQNKSGYISIACELGQPNAAYVRHVLEVLASENNPEYRIAGVGLYRKDELISLQAADFLAHSYSTRDQPWLAYLIRTGRVFYADISPEQLIETSNEIKAMINHRRNLRRKAKKEAKEFNH